MSVYIPGMEMPKENEHAYFAVIHANGTVEYNKGEGWQTGKALSVPLVIHMMPAIIPADREGEG